MVASESSRGSLLETSRRCRFSPGNRGESLDSQFASTALKGFRRDAFANVIGRAWIAFVLFITTPIYVAILGVEAYGLIAIQTTLQTLFAVLDLGLGLTINRQLAKLSEDALRNAQKMRDTLRTFESANVLIAAAIAAAVALAAQPLASFWFHTNALSPARVAMSITLIGATVAVQWPSALYVGGLYGLQRQVAANVLLGIAAAMRAAGSVAILSIAPAVEAFLAWQVFAGVVQSVLLRIALAGAIPVVGTTRFRLDIFRSNLGFAAGLSAITVLATLLTQVDKVVLSSLVPLASFGYYALASTGASALYVLIGPVFNASFPRLVRDALVGDIELARTYHTSCQLLSFLLLPSAATLVVFAPEVMSAWIGDERITAETTWLLRVLAAGTALNGLMNLPYALMLAVNWTRLPLLLNVGAVVILLPLIVYLAGRFGTIGGAVAWFALNLGYVLVGVPILHTRILRGAAARWYFEDVGGPFLGTLSMIALARLMLSGADSRGGHFLEVGGALTAASVGAVIGSAAGRTWLLTIGDRLRPTLRRLLGRA